MLMVPRSFAHKERVADFSEKAWRSPSTSPTRRSLSSQIDSHKTTTTSRKRSREPRSDPVRIPSKTIHDDTERPHSDRTSLPPTSISKANQKVKRRDSAQDVLSATSIPTRRKMRGRPSQRLPKCDYVADFSRLMMDDVKPWNRNSLSGTLAASNFDGLFGSMDEPLEDGQMYVGSEGFDSGVLSTRSLSNESLTSLGSPGETGAGDDVSNFSSLIPSSTPDKKQRLFATSQDCSNDHPLSRIGEQKIYFASAPNLPPSQPIRQVSYGKPAKKPKSFKSSLTASLRAIKSAAQSAVKSSADQSVEGNQSEALLARSFFDIQPSLTDDRRPPPSYDVPPAEIRRYLNPVPLEAAQLHFWQEQRPDPTVPDVNKSNGRRKRAKTPIKKLLPRAGSPALIKSLPDEVPLASCLPPNVRTAHASSPPIWLAPDGTPTKRNTAASLLFDPDSPDGPFTLADNASGLRIREPRENRDFLRVFVCEMQMRKNGKLKEDLNLGRARLWLPPVTEAPEGSGERRAGKKKTGVERWQAMSPDDL